MATQSTQPTADNFGFWAMLGALWNMLAKAIKTTERAVNACDHVVATAESHAEYLRRSEQKKLNDKFAAL